MGGVDLLYVPSTVSPIILYNSTYHYTISPIMYYFVAHCFSGQKRKTRHRHIRTRSWPLGAAYAWLLDVSLTNAAIIFKDAGNPTFLNCNAKVAIVSELVELITSTYSIPRMIPQLLGQRHGDFHQLTEQQIQEIGVCRTRPLPVLDDAQISVDRLDSIPLSKPLSINNKRGEFKLQISQ